MQHSMLHTGENGKHSDFPRLRAEVLGPKMEGYKISTDTIFENVPPRQRYVD